MTTDPRLPYDSDLKRQLVEYIRDNFADVFGQHVALLREENGLEELAFRIHCGEFGPLP